ncbi:MAG: radical SAM protein [Eubacteriales bacterium]|nr:radical SAM protein [Eubacteriales bacterium]MDD4079449.1 radical SAM protein [Eubacteriales bacterium]MDD4769345.1 radical SAM protein [Eubacteriales bacterium]
MQYIYGPVPSRRLGLSLGISPIPRKTCNYSCIYCQLGRTDRLTNTRKLFFPVEAIISELEKTLQNQPAFDVATIVGEGEPTLYLGLGALIDQVKARIDKPVAVITNGALMYDPEIREELSKADIVLLSMDAYDQTSFQKINRPHGKIKFAEVYKGLQIFSQQYQGQLWLEIMLMADNADDEALEKYAQLLKELKYQRLYLNTPVRPPAEPDVYALDPDKMQKAVSILGGISIDLLHSQGFHSEIADHNAAILSIIKRHPMNQFEIESFLKTRGCKNIKEVMDNLQQDDAVTAIEYKGYTTYRLK